MILLLFTIFFGLQIALFFGLAVGYLLTWGYLEKLELSITRATTWEGRFPFKGFKEKTHFVTVSDAMGGQVVLPTFMMRQPGVPRDNSDTSASQSNSGTSSASAFQAFKGKGVSLGTDTSTLSTISSNSAS